MRIFLRRPCRSLIARWVAGGLALGAVLGLVMAWVVFRPTIDPAPRSDALVILGPSWPWRTEEAERLMAGGAAEALVVSAHPEDTLGQTPSPCFPSTRRRYEVYCFDPDPATTQGEARAIGRLAREHGWTDITVLTFVPQMNRARVLIGRCYPGGVHMARSPEPYSVLDQLIYQTGAFVKTAVLQGC